MISSDFRRARAWSFGATAVAMALGFAGAASAQSALPQRPVIIPLPDGAPRPSAPVPPPLPAPGPNVITQLSWARQPMPQFPDEAITRGFDGVAAVTLECAFLADGGLNDCKIVQETPLDMGFGEAVLASAADARLAPQVLANAPADGRVRFSVRLKLASDDAPAPIPVAPRATKPKQH